MAALSALQMIDIGERGAAMGPARRAALMIGAWRPELDEASVMAAPLSVRDRWLLALRAAQFGPVLAARQGCAACGASFELALRAEDVGLGPDEAVGALVDGARALTLGDLVAVEGLHEAGLIKAALAARAAPGMSLEAASAALEAADPAANVVLDVACPDCGEVAEVELDVPAFVWSEIVSQGPRILRDVAELARVYHWAERDILAMPVARRRFYLEAVL